MNLIRQNAVQQIKNIFRSVPEIRSVIENQVDFDDKLFSLTQIAVPVSSQDSLCTRAVLQKDLLCVQIEPQTFISTAFKHLVNNAKKSSYYDPFRYKWYFDEWRKIPCWKQLKPTVGNQVVVEFSSPNIAKPLHAGHLRSTLLGNFISNIHDRFGYLSYRMNYLGDWGTQYGLLAVGFKKFGSQEELNKQALKHLLDIYVKANKDEGLHDEAKKYFSKMENGDEEALELWNDFRTLSIANLESIYKTFDIEFDEYQSESQYRLEAKNIIKQLSILGLCQKRADGAMEVVIPAQYSSLNREARYVVQKSDGSTLYISRDMEDFYVPFGRMTNFQTRKGKFELLSDVLNDARERANDGLNRFLIRKEGVDQTKVSEVIGKAYLILTDFSRPRRADYSFSWNDIVSKDNSAFILLYCHARLCSLEAENKMNIDYSADASLLVDIKEHQLIQILAKYEDVLFDAYRAYEPHKIVHYLLFLVRSSTNLEKVNESDNILEMKWYTSLGKL
ncbi:unnamed protein product [Didymodactylos carnosus]|uniref:Probable arginine--tRNA ligase, mitochondrial n=1 Tax=Didymodactylos carnosus TaxID=1234261 RepID=A0A813VZ19_9BILA|nr:unnamed protein product [Didymodactylos carnosus]CAF0853090.1 unnamed protein product [Didymodactylos carnosus]CAF3536562.1 unnamed protein product [Didymodactylos carnosus]CAF3640769.1 unnamed protein product [Didymodactylos carnosus]